MLSHQRGIVIRSPAPPRSSAKATCFIDTSVSVAEGFINCKRGVKYYQLLLQLEKQISAVISKSLSNPIADLIRPKGSRLAHLYDLPEQLAMRPILSATNTCNYAWAKWLDKRLKPLCHLFVYQFNTKEYVKPTNTGLVLH